MSTGRRRDACGTINMPDDKRKSLNVLPTTGAAGKLAELRAQPTPAPSGRGWPPSEAERPGEGAAPAKKLNDETPIDRALDASLTPQQRAIKEKIIEALQQVYDPELPVNLYDLGLIYRLDLRDADDGPSSAGGGAEQGVAVEIDMTLTAPNCPVAEQIPRQVHEAAAAVPGVARVDVRLVWEPKWDKSRMSEAALLELGLM